MKIPRKIYITKILIKNFHEKIRYAHQLFFAKNYSVASVYNFSAKKLQVPRMQSRDRCRLHPSDLGEDLGVVDLEEADPYKAMEQEARKLSENQRAYQSEKNIRSVFGEIVGDCQVRNIIFTIFICDKNQSNYER